MNKEALKKQLDSIRLELQELQVENSKLKEQLQGHERRINPDEELELTQELAAMQEEDTCLTKELAELTTLYKKGKNDLQELEQLQQQVDEQSELIQERQEALATAEREIERLSEQLTRIQDTAELERLRAVANEANKWEARERRLM